MSSKTIRCIKKSVNIIMLLALIVSLFAIINLVGKNSTSDKINNELNNIISEQEKTIIELMSDNDKVEQGNKDLNLIILQLKDENNSLQEINFSLNEQLDNALSEVDALKSEIDKLQKEIERLNKKNSNTSSRDFKSYMSYKAITNKSSKQWKLQQQATTNEDGIRCIDGIPMVAVGTGWGLSVGDIALVTCENGNSFKVIIGDIKDDKHTDAENKTTIANGCRCEFIVEVSELNPTVKRAGNVAILDKYKGYVVDIRKIG